MARPRYATVDEYLAAQPIPARRVLERVRALLRKALPGATEGISYQIPIFKLDGRMVVYFAGFKEHYSLYPATEHVLEVLAKELAGRVHSKATVRLAYDEPVPARLITRFAKVRAAEAAAKAGGAKKTKKRRVGAR